MRIESASLRFDGRYKPNITLNRLAESNQKKASNVDKQRKRAIERVYTDGFRTELKSSSDVSFWKRAMAIPALGLTLISACADNTVDSTTTTPPTTIETTAPTTSTTEAAPTSTTIPKPPTTEAPTTTTTVPETTTTTEAVDVSRTLEENRFYGSPVFFLGNLRKNELNSDMWFNEVTVRGYNLKTITNSDYQGRQVDEIIMEVIVGKNKYGSAHIQNYFVVAPSEMKSIGIIRSNTINNDDNIYDFITIKTNPEVFMQVIEEYIGSNREFFMTVPYKLNLGEPCNTHDVNCDYRNELREYMLINEKYVEDLDLLFEALLSSDPTLYNGLNNYSGSEFGLPAGIRLPPPPEGWEVWDANH